MRRKLRNPGPATSADIIRLSFSNNEHNASAISLGFIFAGLAKTIAAFVDISPWEESRGGSTVTFVKFNSFGNVPLDCNAANEVRTRLLISENKFINLSSYYNCAI